MTTNYEKYFGSPESVNDSVGCCGDCWDCPYLGTDVPCLHKYNSTDEMILNWLNEEVKERSSSETD